MVIKNIKLFVKKNGMLFMLLIVTQIISVIIIVFSYGVYLNNKYTENTKEDKQLTFSVTFNDTETSTGAVALYQSGERLKQVFPDMLVEYEEILLNCRIFSKLLVDEDEITAFSEFSIENGEYRYGYNMNDYSTGISGEYYTESDMNKGAKVCIISKTLWELFGNTIVFNGENYDVISREKEEEEIHTAIGMMVFKLQDVIIPAESLPDKAKVTEITLILTRPLVKSEYDTLKNKFQQTFGYGVLKFSDFYVVSADENATAKTMMTISIFLSILSSYCICMIYKFVLDKRLKMTAIYQICGSTPWKAAKIYLKELFLIQICCAVLGLVSFWYILKPKVSQQYIWFEIIYGDWKCFLFLGIYIVLVWFSSIMMIKNEIRKTPIVMLKR